jgi:hypothetical protein
MKSSNLAIVLSKRRGLATSAVQDWLSARGLVKPQDLTRFGMDHATSMENALADFWHYAMAEA